MKKQELNMNKKSAMEKAGQITKLKTNLQQQDEYVASMVLVHKNNVPLISTKKFMVSIRDSGYKSTGTAINELIDNAVQANPSQVFILCTIVNNDIGDIFVIDDGHGMSPEMMRFAVSWAGTHRHLSDDFWGKYGFGLPSAAMFLTEDYSVFSKRKDDDHWSELNISLKTIQATNYDSSDGVVISPKAKPSAIPMEVQKYLKKVGFNLMHGTIIQLKSPKEYITGITWGFSTPSSLERGLLRTIGSTYREFSIRGITITVNNNVVEPIDPLFISENCRYFDKRGDKAKDTEHEVKGESIDFLKETEEGRKLLFDQGILAIPFEPVEVKIKAPNGSWATLRLRFSLMHPNFAKDWHGDRLAPKAKSSPRYQIMRENNGYLIVTRAGRQIDVVDAKFENSSLGVPTQNYGRYWAVELDFDPVLDAYFGITVNKQQVNLSREIWEVLASTKNNVNIPSFIRRELQNKVVGFFHKERQERLEEEQKRHNSKAQEAASKHGNFNPDRVNETTRRKANEELASESASKAKAEGKTVEQAEQELLEKYAGEKYSISYEAIPLGPIARIKFIQPGQIRVIYNRTHPFIKQFYLSSGFNAVIRDAIDAYFFAWGESYMTSNEERQLIMDQIMIDISSRSLATLNFIAGAHNLEEEEEYQKNNEEN